MTFRPLPILTLASLPALALLIWLGVWQLDRAEQKRAMIADYEASAAAEAHDDLHAPFCQTRASAYGQRAAMPQSLVGEEVRFYGARASDGAPGWRILRLAPTPDCDCTPEQAEDCLRDDLFLVVDAGFETLSGDRTDPPAVVTIDRPPQIGAFTPQNDAQRGEFYRFERDALARAFGVEPDQVDPDWQLKAEAPGLPPGLAAMPPSRHIGYALTWFGLAATLVGVYLAFHHRQGRFRARRDA